MLFGFGLAYLLSSRYLAPATRNLFRILLTIPLVIPPVVAAFTWKTLIFDPTLGMLNYVLGLFTESTVDFINDPRLTLVGLLLVEVTLRTSFVLIILFAGFQSLPLPLYEAAAIDGASAWHELIYITIPLLRPLLIIAFVFRLMDAFKVFDIIFVLTRGGPGFLTENIAVFSVNHTFDFLKRRVRRCRHDTAADQRHGPVHHTSQCNADGEVSHAQAYCQLPGKIHARTPVVDRRHPVVRVSDHLGIPDLDKAPRGRHFDTADVAVHSDDCELPVDTAKGRLHAGPAEQHDHRAWRRH